MAVSADFWAKTTVQIDLSSQANVASGQGNESRKQKTNTMLKGITLLVHCEGVFVAKVSFAAIECGRLKDKNLSAKSITAEALCTATWALSKNQGCT